MNRIAMPRLAAALLFLFPIGPLGARLAAAQSSDAKLAELGQLASADDAKGALEKLVAALGHDVPRGQLTAALAIAALADRPPADTDGDDGPDFATAAAALLPVTCMSISRSRITSSSSVMATTLLAVCR